MLPCAAGITGGGFASLVGRGLVLGLDVTLSSGLGAITDECVHSMKLCGCCPKHGLAPSVPQMMISIEGKFHHRYSSSHYHHDLHLALTYTPANRYTTPPLQLTLALTLSLPRISARR